MSPDVDQPDADDDTTAAPADSSSDAAALDVQTSTDTAATANDTSTTATNDTSIGSDVTSTTPDATDAADMSDDVISNPQPDCTPLPVRPVPDASSLSHGINPSISPNGLDLYFQSNEPLAAGDSNAVTDIYKSSRAANVMDATWDLTLMSSWPQRNDNFGHFHPYATDVGALWISRENPNSPALPYESERIVNVYGANTETFAPISGSNPYSRPSVSVSTGFSTIGFLTADATGGTEVMDNNGISDLWVSAELDGGLWAASAESETATGAVEGELARGSDFAVFTTGRDIGNDSNGALDVYLIDFTKAPDGATPRRISTTVEDLAATDGESRWPAIDAQGTWVAYGTKSNQIPLTAGNGALILANATTPTDRYVVHDFPNDTEGLGDHAISADGRFVAFTAVGPVADISNPLGSSQIWVYGRENEAVALVSAFQGKPGHDDSWSPTISGSGCVIAFTSKAINLGGHNDVRDVDAVHVRSLPPATAMFWRPVDL